MTIHWFHVPTLPATDDAVTLEAREAAHAAARRLRAGEIIRLFDGAGGVAEATMLPARSGSRGITVRVDSVEHHAPPAPRLHLAAALPTGDRLGVMLDMATQLGMTDFTPLHCERGRLPRRDDAPDKWRRIMVESCKQCRRAWLPVVHPSAAPIEVVLAASTGGGLALLADLQGEAVADAIASSDHGASAAITCLVGPEGGFTDTEVNAIKAAGARSVTLGEHVLRVETAAAAMLAVARALVKPASRTSR